MTQENLKFEGDATVHADSERVPFGRPTDREHREIQVTLHDGRVVGSWSEEWRAETEARGLLRIPSKEDRRKYLALVAKKRGEAAAERLKQRTLAIWRAERDGRTAAQVGQAGKADVEN